MIKLVDFMFPPPTNLNRHSSAVLIFQCPGYTNLYHFIYEQRLIAQKCATYHIHWSTISKYLWWLAI